MYTYIPLSPPSCVSLTPSISHPFRWSQSTELISLCYAAASHQVSILHLVVYICPCHSLTSLQLTLPPPRVHFLCLRLYSCPTTGFIRTNFLTFIPPFFKFSDFCLLFAPLYQFIYFYSQLSLISVLPSLFRLCLKKRKKYDKINSAVVLSLLVQ